MHNTRQNNPVLVTGSKGQLATSLARLGGAAVKCVGRPDFDFDRPETLRAVLDSVQPAVVINAAAWSAVDLAESEPEAAARANTQGSSELARLCALRNIPFIHISTDYVFLGIRGHLMWRQMPFLPKLFMAEPKLRAKCGYWPRTRKV